MQEADIRHYAGFILCESNSGAAGVVVCLCGVRPQTSEEPINMTVVLRVKLTTTFALDGMTIGDVMRLAAQIETSGG